MIRIAAAVAASIALAACGGEPVSQSEKLAAPEASAAAASETAPSTDSIAEDFVKLALGVGQHDAAFVDAYHGPAEWVAAAESEQRSLEALEADAHALLTAIESVNGDAPDIRGAMLEKLIRAALTRIQMVRGQTFSFDEETRLLYDAVAPEYDVAVFDAALENIDALLPGEGPLNERVDSFRNRLAIPEDKLQPVFDAAIAECKARTLAHYDLPEGERFSVEYVNDKPWSGYNWYQGDYESLIQVNTDFPIIIDRAVDLGCHEGYPGHHVWNSLLERDVLGREGWIEYSVYPLFSPLSVTAEGSANYGIELAFPGDEKIEFERDVLFPLAGLDPEDAAKLAELNALQGELSHARNMIARDYLDGRIDRHTAIAMMAKYRLESEARAEQSIRFVETYRGYVLNYTIGRDIIADYVERNAGGEEGRWAAFETLLTTPLSASDLAGPG